MRGADLNLKFSGTDLLFSLKSIYFAIFQVTYELRWQ